MAWNDRREFLSAALFGAAGGSVAGLPEGTTVAADEGPRARGTGPIPEGALAGRPRVSPGHRRRGAAGRVRLRPGAEVYLKADMETQVRQTFDRIGLVLKAAGASFADVVMLRGRISSTSTGTSPAYRKVRLEYLREPYPASTAVGVTELAVAGFLTIEIEAIAIV